MVKLSFRLENISKLINESDIIADVGSDHGHLPIFLIKSGLVKKAYAIDNKKGPFEGLQNNVKKAEADVTCILSDGISDLPNDVNTLVLAGLGAHTIVEILSKKEKLKNVTSIITDAHTEMAYLRENIIKLGFFIKKEVMINDAGIYYTLIRFERGLMEYTSKEILYGPILLKEKPEIFQTFWNNRKNYLTNILKNNLNETKKNEIISEIERIDSIL